MCVWRGLLEKKRTGIMYMCVCVCVCSCLFTCDDQWFLGGCWVSDAKKERKKERKKIDELYQIQSIIFLHTNNLFLEKFEKYRKPHVSHHEIWYQGEYKLKNIMMLILNERCEVREFLTGSVLPCHENHSISHQR